MGGREAGSSKQSGSVLAVVFVVSSLREGEGGRKEEEKGWEENFDEGEHGFRCKKLGVKSRREGE